MKTNKSILRRPCIMACLFMLTALVASAQSTSPTLTVKEKKGKVGLTVKDLIFSTKVLPYEYDSIQALGKDLFRVTKGSLHGLFYCKINPAYPKAASEPADTKWLVPCDYEDYHYYGRNTIVKKDGKWGVIHSDDFGNLIQNVPCQYDGLSLDKNRTSIKVVDGDTLISDWGSELYFFSKQNGKKGYLSFTYDNNQYKELPCKYDGVKTLHSDNEYIGLIIIDYGRYGLASIDDYRILIPCENDNTSFRYYNEVGFHKDMEVIKDGKVGIYSMSHNKMLIPFGDYKSGSEEYTGNGNNVRMNLTRNDGTTATFDALGNLLTNATAWGQRVDAQRFNKMGSGEFFYVSKATSGPYTAIVNKNDKVIVNLANTKIVGYNETQESMLPLFFCNKWAHRK